MSRAPVVYTCDDHSSVYAHLRAGSARGLSVTHLDAHCDLKGTLIDRSAGRAWLRRQDLPVSASTYLSHLVAQGIVGDLTWIHDEIGGRRNDLGTVLYTSDLDRVAYRLVRSPGGPGVALTYDEGAYDAWRHRDTGRILDIDWDFFADFRKSERRASAELDALLNEKLEAVPHCTYVAYSSHYSRPSREGYESFVVRLAQRLSARVEAISEAPLQPSGGFARALPPGLRRFLKTGALRAKRVWFR